MRINKYIASCGITSRRKSEMYVLSGKVSINGKIVKNLSTNVNIDKDIVRLNNKNINIVMKKKYYLVNKPKGYISTVSDERGRKTVIDIVGSKERLFPVGRLDYNTEGIIILTNDGNLANKLMHPSYEVDKTYIVKVRGTVKGSELALLKKGIILDKKTAVFKDVRLISFEDGISRVKVVINQGINRQIRRMFESIDKEIINLKRVAIGQIVLGGMSRRSYRELNEHELFYLKKL